MSPALDTLTEDHAAVYDRQLRVWGVEVQRRLMDAKVLIIGLGGLAAEIAKNIVLAGVGTVTLLDNTPATSAAPGNFLVEPGSAAGKSVAEACAATLQAMNPLMTVRVEPGPPSTAALLQQQQQQDPAEATPPPEAAASAAATAAPAEALRSLVSRYDTVVACGLPLRELAALSELCRGLGRQLFAGGVRGASSFVFVDLGPRHTYTVKGEAGEKVFEYGSFRSTMSADLAAVGKRTHPLYLVLRACWEFEEAHSRPAAGPADVAAVRLAAERLAAATAAAKAGGGAAAALLPEGLVESFVLDAAAPSSPAAAEPQSEPEAAEAAAAAEPLGELAPVCAVVGGVVANNVLRAVSHVGPPLRNLFCYSLLVRDGLGMEECFVGAA
ncbi:hypothetical protein PLESTB_000769800 [Pleodorina starrii]|uniref:THIF-type NAD/FAD binding fold domain-containing protein n=1 Tax=Pleodorina starrii TaxID=330485 RepID=A0A9W6F269_9CHLO|nr:hypothetical protein PLESTM_000435400 [Pleodorina starrii]GLC53622.1 hypothetical protein PLESTB_000769800 [Pleodorina starrii]GLC65683.1 hypothetical protein PLESTF_000328600 [Pleodorina starrii]